MSDIITNMFCFDLFYTFQEVVSPKHKNDNGLKNHLLKACETVKASNVSDFRVEWRLNKDRWLISRRFRLCSA